MSAELNYLDPSAVDYVPLCKSGSSMKFKDPNTGEWKEVCGANPELKYLDPSGKWLPLCCGAGGGCMKSLFTAQIPYNYAPDDLRIVAANSIYLGSKCAYNDGPALDFVVYALEEDFIVLIWDEGTYRWVEDSWNSAPNLYSKSDRGKYYVVSKSGATLHQGTHTLKNKGSWSGDTTGHTFPLTKNLTIGPVRQPGASSNLNDGDYVHDDPMQFIYRNPATNEITFGELGMNYPDKGSEAVFLHDPTTGAVWMQIFTDDSIYENNHVGHYWKWDKPDDSATSPGGSSSYTWSSALAASVIPNWYNPPGNASGWRLRYGTAAARGPYLYFIALNYPDNGTALVRWNTETSDVEMFTLDSERARPASLYHWYNGDLFVSLPTSRSGDTATEYRVISTPDVLAETTTRLSAPITPYPATGMSTSKMFQMRGGGVGIQQLGWTSVVSGSGNMVYAWSMILSDLSTSQVLNRLSLPIGAKSNVVLDYEQRSGDGGAGFVIAWSPLETDTETLTTPRWMWTDMADEDGNPSPNAYLRVRTPVYTPDGLCYDVITDEELDSFTPRLSFGWNRSMVYPEGYYPSPGPLEYKAQALVVLETGEPTGLNDLSSLIPITLFVTPQFSNPATFGYDDYFAFGYQMRVIVWEPNSNIYDSDGNYIMPPYKDWYGGYWLNGTWPETFIFTGMCYGFTIQWKRYSLTHPHGPEGNELGTPYSGPWGPLADGETIVQNMFRLSNISWYRRTKTEHTMTVAAFSTCPVM